MKNNHVYIDESGTFKNNNIFIICFVIFKDLNCLNYTISSIESFKNKTFKCNDVELHFNKESSSIKKKFFGILNRDKFSIRYFILKSNNYFLSNIDLLINAFIDNKDVVENSMVFIDGFKSRLYNKKVISKIKKTLKSNGIQIKSIKYTDSKNSPPIQLADMCRVYT